MSQAFKSHDNATSSSAKSRLTGQAIRQLSNNVQGSQPQYATGSNSKVRDCQQHIPLKGEEYILALFSSPFSDAAGPT